MVTNDAMSKQQLLMRQSRAPELGDDRQQWEEIVIKCQWAHWC